MSLEGADAWRNYETAVQPSDRQAGRRDAIIVEKLVETLRLAGVVTQNRGRDSVGDDLFQPFDIALDFLGPAEWKQDSRVGAGEIDRPERVDRSERGLRGFEQLITARSVFSPSPREIDVVLRFSPGSLELRLDVGSNRDHEDSVRRKKGPNRRALRLALADGDLPVNGKNQRNFGITRGSLGEEIEVAKLGYVIAPEFQAHGFRHAEAVNVEDPAAHAELSDVFHHRNALETDLFEVRSQSLGPADIALAELDACGGEGARKLGALEHRAAGGDDDPEIAAADPFERLSRFARDFGVGFCLTEALARRIEGDALGLNERAEIGEPPLGAGNVVVQHNEEPVRKILGERSDDDRIARAMKSAYSRAGRGCGDFP